MPAITAVFDSQQAATLALERLQRHGFSSTDVRCEVDGKFRASPTAGVSPSSGFMAAMAHLFSPAGRADDADAGVRENVLHRGEIVVSVRANTRVEGECARLLMHEAGAIDVAERAQRYEESRGLEEPGGVPPADTRESVRNRALVIGGLPLVLRDGVSRSPAEGVADETGWQAEHSRRPGNQANEVDFATFREGLLEVREVRELLVITKHVRVVEEIRINKSVSILSDTVNETLRGTAIDVERLAGPGPSHAGP